MVGNPEFPCRRSSIERALAARPRSAAECYRTTDGQEGKLPLLFTWNFGAFFACFGKPDGNRLLPALDAATLATFTGLQGALLTAMHRALNALLCGFSVSRHLLPPLRSKYRAPYCTNERR